MTYKILPYATYHGGPFRCDVLALKASGSQKGREILEPFPWEFLNGGYFQYLQGIPMRAFMFRPLETTRIQYA